jgi:hypothetical protein
MASPENGLSRFYRESARLSRSLYCVSHDDRLGFAEMTMHLSLHRELESLRPALLRFLILREMRELTVREPTGEDGESK